MRLRRFQPLPTQLKYTVQRMKLHTHLFIAWLAWFCYPFTNNFISLFTVHNCEEYITDKNKS